MQTITTGAYDVEHAFHTDDDSADCLELPMTLPILDVDEAAAEKRDEALDELRVLLGEIRARSEDICYGYFPGGDPRKFSPDYECSTEEEREAHAKACAAWEAGEREPVPGPHKPLYGSRGERIGHLTRSGFGLGTTVIEDDIMVDIAERLERILDRLERE